MKRLLIVLIAAWPATSLAYRPFNGTDADVASVRQFEFEIGAFGYLHQGSRDILVAPTLIANYGFARELELVLEGREFVRFDAQPGESRVQLVDTALSLKWVLREG